MCQGEELEPLEEAGRVIQKWRDLKEGRIILSFPQVLALSVRIPQ